jgi:transcriptional regulator with XRE-family HTH domain
VPLWPEMAHPLAKVLENQKLTQQEFADRAGVHRTVITKLLSGDRKSVGASAAKRIVKAARGQITFEQVLGSVA